MKRIFDAAIVGSGPSGGCLAYLLADHGLQVLLLDKKRLPRYKACGGGITPRAMRLMPVDIGAVVEDRTTTAHLRVNGHTAFTRTYPRTVVSMVMRGRLDHLLVEEAVKRGAQLLTETRFLAVRPQLDGLEIETSRGTLAARCLVGADGVHSRVARQLGLPVGYRTMTAVEAELEPEDSRLMDRFRHTFDFDFGVIDQGYGWVFPKRRHLSAGILTRRPRARAVRSALAGYFERKDLAGARTVSLRLHPIPYAPRSTNRYANARGLVVGDATGMVDPVTGEGIYYALYTARLAAKAICAFHQQGVSLTNYDEALRRTLGRELRYAGGLAEILYRLPWMSYPMLRRFGGQIGGKYMEIFDGRLDYAGLVRYILSTKGIRHLLSGPGRRGVPAVQVPLPPERRPDHTAAPGRRPSG